MQLTLAILHALCWQAREENKGMIDVLVNSRQRGDAQRGAMLRIPVTETWSSEGRKVFHAYGGDQRKDQILFLAPSTGRNATLLGEIADTETDTHDEILKHIIERAALHITKEGQQREQYAKWRLERNDQVEELGNEIRKTRELWLSEEPQSGRQIKVTDLEGKQWMRKFKETAYFQEVYDWLGSSKTIPLYFNLQRGNNVLRHCDQLQGDEVLHIWEWENKKREEKESSDKISQAMNWMETTQKKNEKKRHQKQKREKTKKKERT
ncbi:hypothetical protein AWC38_SpisGene11711 [Stylophora pistillata]|uniref:Uncharacterized protein n=1 Tax=Stylophora pistillata TaxID=50429 RepID=A0A2B4RZ52_STYPI|nr:hypothetical protein AWC38_SpisGene11711 [Stylophora pistillata]